MSAATATLEQKPLNAEANAGPNEFKYAPTRGPATAPPLAPKGRATGDIEESYHFGRVLGMGSHSVVRAVTDKETGVQWACKCLTVELPSGRSSTHSHKNPSNVARPRTLQAVYLEIDIMFRMQHQGVAQIREWFQEGDKVWIILEYCRGKDFLQSIACTPSGRLSEAESRSVTVQLLEVLQYVHGHDIVHRDLKLDNVMCVPSSTGEKHVKLLDFSLAADTLNGPLTTACGTSYYAAPEVITSEESDGYSKQCDMWSLGVMLFVMLCGEMPFFSEDNGELYERVKSGNYDMDTPLWSSVSGDAKDLVCRMLDVHPESRISSIDALKHPWARAERDLNQQPTRSK